MASEGCSSLSFSLRKLFVWSRGLYIVGSVVVAHGLRCPEVWDLFRPCPLHWQADSQPLDHQGDYCHLKTHFRKPQGALCFLIFLCEMVVYSAILTLQLWIQPPRLPGLPCDALTLTPVGTPRTRTQGSSRRREPSRNI